MGANPRGSMSGCVSGLGSLPGFGWLGVGKLGRTKVRTSWCLVVVRVTSFSVSGAGLGVAPAMSAEIVGGVAEAGVASG